MKAPRKPAQVRKLSPETRFFRSDTESGLARKRRQEETGRTTGLVEIPGPLPAGLDEEVRNLAARLESEEERRRPGGRVLTITPFEEGLAIETQGEKLAQRIADALAKSRHARVERTFDDEGRRRILTCRLPGVGEG
jgi:hypothetical protein